LVAIKPCLKSAPQELELDLTARQNLFAPTRPPWQLINQTVKTIETTRAGFTHHFSSLNRAYGWNGEMFSLKEQ